MMTDIGHTLYVTDLQIGCRQSAKVENCCTEITTSCFSHVTSAMRYRYLQDRLQ